MDTQNQDMGGGPATPPPSFTPPAGSAGGQKNTGMAMIAYLGILVLIPLLTEAKNDPFVKFHIKQGLLVLIGLVISSIVAVVPFLGWAIASILWLASIVLMVLGLVNAANGNEHKLPVVGHLADNFHF